VLGERDGGREKIDELNDWIADQIQRIYRPGG